MKSPIKYHGGKSYLAKDIVAAMPPHARYLEAFSGGLSVLCAKPSEGVAEWVNDLDGELANFWRVLRDAPDRMLRALWGTPLSQDEFIEATRTLTGSTADKVQRATAYFIRNRQSRQGLGKDYCTPTRRLRRGMNEQVSAWLSAIDGLPEMRDRLSRVEVWNRPAVEAITALDGEDLLVYADPPYLFETRSSTGEYGKFEMSEPQHIELLECLLRMKGKFILSGYASPLYEHFALVGRWRRTDFNLPNNSSSAKTKERKIECVWSNY